MFWSLFRKLGETFEIFFFYLLKFEKNLESKIGCVHGAHCPKSRIGMCKASLSHPS